MNVRYEKEELNKTSTNHVFITEYWKLSIGDAKSKELKKKLEEMVDKRTDWETHLFEAMIELLSVVKVKNRQASILLWKFDDNFSSIVNAWKKKVELRETSKQTTIEEATKTAVKVKPFGRTEVKPLRKKRR